MSETSSKKEIDPKIKAMAIIIILLLLGVIVGLALSHVSIAYAKKRVSEQLEKVSQRLEMFIQAYADMYTLGTTIICINIFLLLGLLIIYSDSFRKTKSTFLFGLLLFIGVLFIQAILSLPILQAGLGYGSYDISLSGVLPNFFETIALAILLYLSME
jgi:hypothetical protein